MILGRLLDKVAIITGGASGQGEAAVKLFAKEGAKVVIVDWSEENGIRVEQEVKNDGYDVMFVHTDVSKEDSVINMVNKTVEKYGTVDILFNNAGIGYSSSNKYKMANLVDTPLKDWNAVIEINLGGMYLCSKHILPIMREKGKGNIVNNSSMNGIIGESNADAYTAAKGGIVALTRVMAKDNAKYGIRVNCMCPGGVDTPMIAPIFEMYPEAKAMAGSQIPLGRLAEPVEMANIALFLASEESSYITGVILPVDGGWYAV